MKRWPLITSFVMFIALCMSAAYWAMQLYKPPLRAIAAPSQADRPAPKVDAAAGLFGGRSSFAVASNYQLKGVVVASNPAESVAILAVNGKSPQAIRTNAQVTPGVTVQEVHKGYVLLSESGVVKRVELPENKMAQMKVGISANAMVQMKVDKSTNAVGTVSPPAPLPDISYGSKLLGKYYTDRNAKLRQTSPPKP